MSSGNSGFSFFFLLPSESSSKVESCSYTDLNDDNSCWRFEFISNKILCLFSWLITDSFFKELFSLSRDLLSRWGGPFNYGDYVIIEGTGKDDGVYQVRDTMNP